MRFEFKRVEYQTCIIFIQKIFAYMSSQSDQQHSSSSPVERPYQHREENNRSRSRSRQKHRRRYQYDENRSKPGKRKHVIKVPEFSNELLSLRAFMLNHTENINKQKAEKEYEAYKQKWEETNNQAFFVQHKNDAWFQQRYNPEVLDAIERERKQNVVSLAAQFYSNFKNGFYDKIDLSIKDPNKLGFICNDRQDENDDFRDVSGMGNGSSGVPVHLQTIDVNISNSLKLAQEKFYGFDPDAYTLFIKAIPRTISKFDILEIVGKLQGFKNITLSEPVKKLSFARYCWITFDDQNSLINAQAGMNGCIIKKEPIAFGRSLSKARRIKVLKNYPVNRIKIDSALCKKLADRLDRDAEIQDNPLLKHQFESQKKQFDTFLLYLRKVHAYDYYTSTSYFNERSLCLKLGLAYLRVEAQIEELPNIDTVFKKMQEAAENVIQNGLNVPDHFKYFRQEMQKVVTKIVADKQGKSIEQTTKKQIWNCISCNKRFKTCEFLAKHVIAKHNQLKDKKIEEIMEIGYMKDPRKLTNYPSNRDDRENNKNKRMGFKRDRKKDYKDLDQPQGPQVERTGPKRIMNFLDI